MEDHDIRLSASEISSFLSALGGMPGGKTKAERTLSLLGQVVPNIQMVMGTEIGKEILKDDVNAYLSLRVKAERCELNPNEEAEYLYLRNKRLPALAQRIRVYLESVGKIKAEVRK